MPNPWDNDPVVGSAQGGPTYGPPPRVDPYKARDQELQEDAARRAAEDQAFQREKFGWEREKFERELAQGGKSEASAKTRQDAITGYKAAQSLRRLVADMRQRHAAGPGATSGPLGVVDYLPTQTNQGFDAAGNAARGIVGQALGFTGGQLNSVQEAEMAIGPYLPKASDFDDVSLDKINRLEALAADAEDRAIALLGGVPDENGRVTPVDAQAPEQADQSRNLAEIEAPSAQQLAPSTNGFETVDNPELAGVRGEYLRRLEAGNGPGELVQFLRSAGITDPKVLRSAVEQANFRRQNPNVPIANYNTEALDDMDVPLSGIEGAMNSAAQSAPGAYAMHAGQTASLNTLDNVVGMTGGNAERARIGLADASSAHPVASFAGDLSGGVMAALGGEAALGGLGMGAGFGRAALADAGFGAGTGAGAADDGSRLMGAAQGGLAGLAGSVVGQGAVKGIGSAISPTGGRLSDLYAAGVRPTPGQRMLAAGDGKGVGGLVGRAVNAGEEAISSVPVVGSAIRGARQEARDQFQIGAYNEALKEVGKKLPKGMKAGTAPYAFTKKVFDDAYDNARSGMRLAADEELSNQVGELAGQISSLAEPSIKRFEAIVKNVLLRRVQGEQIDGATFKKIQSEIGSTVRGIRKNQSGDGELADALDELSGILDSAARRHSDPAAVKALDAADAGYAKFVRIRDAAKARGGGAAEFSPTQFDRSVQRNTGGKHSDAYLRGDALMQDYAEQGMSLVDRTPNSGTADRLWMGAGAAGLAGYAEPSSLGLLGILGALYAPGVRKATTGVMAPRGPKAKAVADQVRKRARIAGAGGAVISSQTPADQ